jgi:hypothetical protein
MNEYDMICEQHGILDPSVEEPSMARVPSQPSCCPKYTVERHGDGWAIYSGRDMRHHGLNLGCLTECEDYLPSLIEKALNAYSDNVKVRHAANE